MDRSLNEMYCDEDNNILIQWMEKLFPRNTQGCINFGYWKNIKLPLTIEKRIESQRNLYFEIYKRFSENPSKILEVGCGRGHGIFWLRDKGYDAFGIDILENQISSSKESYSELSNYLRVGKAEEIPFENSTFDHIYSIEAVQHFSSFIDFCKESYRVLNNSGKLIISTYFFTKYEYKNDVRKIIPDNLEGYDNALVISEAIALLKENGFELTMLSSIGEEVFPLYSYWQKKALGGTPTSDLNRERKKWKDYYSGGGNRDHPWLIAFKNGWIDYYILELTKKKI